MTPMRKQPAERRFNRGSRPDLKAVIAGFIVLLLPKMARQSAIGIPANNPDNWQGKWGIFSAAGEPLMRIGLDVELPGSACDHAARVR